MFSKSLPHLRVLLLEDDPRDAELITHALEAVETRCTVLRVDSRQAFVSALDSFAPDLILSDHGVPNLSALDALHLTQSHLPEAAFLLVSGAFKPTTSETLRSGASDFIIKSDLSRLGSAIHRALKLRAPLRRLSKRQRQVLQMLAAGASTREIARRLGLSVKTVETHRSQVMHRTGIHDLASLVRFAVQVGIVSPGQRIDGESPSPARGSGNPRW